MSQKLDHLQKLDLVVVHESGYGQARIGIFYKGSQKSIWYVPVSDLTQTFHKRARGQARQQNWDGWLAKKGITTIPEHREYLADALANEYIQSDRCHSHIRTRWNDQQRVFRATLDNLNESQLSMAEAIIEKIKGITFDEWLQQQERSSKMTS